MKSQDSSDIEQFALLLKNDIEKLDKKLSKHTRDPIFDFWFDYY